MIWVCRCGSKGEYEDIFLSKNCIGIVAEDLPIFNKPVFSGDLKRLLMKYIPNKESIRSLLPRINAIVVKMNVGDIVLVPSKRNHNLYYVGIISSDYIFDKNNLLTFSRKVDWKGTLKRKEVDDETYKSLGSAITIFAVKSSSSFDKILATYIN